MLLTEEDIQRFNSQPNNNQEINDISDLVLVHVTNYLPKDGVIRTPKSVGATLPSYCFGKEFEYVRERDTIHFCVNGCVTPNTGGSFNAKYAIIIPLKNIPKEKIADGCLADIFVKGDLEIPDGSYFMYPDDENIDGIGENLEFIPYKKTSETPFVNNYVDLALSNLGYRYEEIGASDWVKHPLKSAKAKEIIRQNGIHYDDILHTFTNHMKDELAYEANNQTQQIIKIFMDYGLENVVPNECLAKLDDMIYSLPQGHAFFRTSNLDYSKKDYISDLFQKLESIGLIIPESVRQEVEKANGELEFEEKLKILNIKDIDDNFDKKEEINYHFAGLILKRRIIGEIKLAEIKKELGEKNGFIDLLNVFNNDLFDYISKERKIEFVKELGINLTNKEIEILTNRELLKQYLYVYKLKDVNFSDLEPSNKEIINSIVEYYCENYKRSDNFMMLNEILNGKLYPKITNPKTFNFSEEEKERILSEVIKFTESSIVLNFELEFLDNENLLQFMERYVNYINKVVQTLGDENIKYDSSHKPNIVLDTIFEQYITSMVKTKQNQQQVFDVNNEDEIGRTR